MECCWPMYNVIGTTWITLVVDTLSFFTHGIASNYADLQSIGYLATNANTNTNISIKTYLKIWYVKWRFLKVAVLNLGLIQWPAVILFATLKGPIPAERYTSEFYNRVSSLWGNGPPISRKWTWWRHQMETFYASLAIDAGNSPVTGEFPAQRPVTRSFDAFFDMRLNKWLSKQSWGDPRRHRAHCDVIVMTFWGRDKMATDFTADIFICILMKQNFWISNEYSLKYVPGV